MNNVGQQAIVLRNDGGNRQHWLGIRVAGRKSNRAGIGARVKVVAASGLTQYATVTTAVGYLSASDRRLIVGLGGDATAALVEIGGRLWVSATTLRRARFGTTRSEQSIGVVNVALLGGLAKPAAPKLETEAGS